MNTWGGITRATSLHLYLYGPHESCPSPADREGSSTAIRPRRPAPDARGCRPAVRPAIAAFAGPAKTERSGGSAPQDGQNGRGAVVQGNAEHMRHELVRRAQAGDHDAFSALAAASIARLYRTARLILRDDELARDATQDTLVRAWLEIRALRDPERFEAWLHRALVRTCYAAAGRSRRRRALEVRVDEIDRMGDPGDGARLDARDAVDRGFRRLTTEQRAVLVVHHYLGLGDAEASSVLGIPLGTYKSRLHRATAALRAAIEADDRASVAATESVA